MPPLTSVAHSGAICSPVARTVAPVWPRLRDRMPSTILGPASIHS